MPARLKQADLNWVAEAGQTAFTECCEKEGIEATMEFSWQLTSSIGNARGDKMLVKLSVPIIRRMIRDKGVSHSIREVRNTVAHEVAHLVTSDGHGPQWRAAMRRLGYKPVQRHTEKCGADLYSSLEQRQGYPVGRWVFVTLDGQEKQGRILRHNTKTLAVSMGDSAGYWRIPWRLVGNIVTL